MVNKKIKISISVILLVFLCAITTVIASGSTSKTVASSGHVTALNISVFSDSACTVPLTSLDFGIIDASGSNSLTVYLKNTGNKQVTLSMTSNTWIPVSSGITLSWNKEAVVLGNGASVAAIITVTLPASPGYTDFSFNTVFTGIN